MLSATDPLPGFRRQQVAGRADVWCVDLDRAEFGHAPHWDYLSGDEQARAQAFATDVLRARYTRGRAALRLILASYLGGDARAIALTYGPYGKPALAHPCAAEDAGFGGRLEFNVSHSGAQALIGVTRHGCIGIDLERIRSDFDVEAIAERFFSAAERASFFALPSALAPQAFYHTWTCKEAYLKALGSGLQVPLDEFDVCVDPRRPAVLLRPHLSATEDFALYTLPVSDGFAAAVALSLEPTPPVAST
jgi:4'-phosphopantetheinyl transferase